MKKMRALFSVLLVLALLVGTVSLAETNSETGIWEKRFYVDEFDLPTDEFYIGNAEPIVGKFSNSATTDSEMYAFIIVDDGKVGIRLVEYGSNVVKNSYSQDRVYNMVLMDPSEEKHYFDGYMQSGSDAITFDSEGNGIIIAALGANGTVRFSITEEDSPTTKYLFIVEDSSGFNDCFPYKSVNSFHDGLALVYKNGRYGFIDVNGDLVIPCQYETASDFSDGVAYVGNYIKNSFYPLDASFGAIDTSGAFVVPFGTYRTRNRSEFTEGMAPVRLNSGWGFVNTSGELAIDCEYSDAYYFREGMAEVVKDQKSGFVNASGELVIPCEYDEANSFYEGFASVEKDEKYGFVDTTGELVIPCEYDYVGSFSEGFALAEKDEKYGFVDTTGELVIPCEYDHVGSFSEGFAAVVKDDKCGYIDTTGKLVIPCEYDDVGSFSEGLARVVKDDKCGYIDTTGMLVIPCEYDSASNFKEGFAEVTMNEKDGFINTTGELVIPCEYSSAAYGEGYFALAQDAKIITISRDEL